MTIFYMPKSVHVGTDYSNSNSITIEMPAPVQMAVCVLQGFSFNTGTNDSPEINCMKVQIVSTTIENSTSVVCAYETDLAGGDCEWWVGTMSIMCIAQGYSGDVSLMAQSATIDVGTSWGSNGQKTETFPTSPLYGGTCALQGFSFNTGSNDEPELSNLTALCNEGDIAVSGSTVTYGYQAKFLGRDSEWWVGTLTVACLALANPIGRTLTNNNLDIGFSIDSYLANDGTSTLPYDKVFESPGFQSVVPWMTGFIVNYSDNFLATAAYVGMGEISDDEVEYYALTAPDVDSDDHSGILIGFLGFNPQDAKSRSTRSSEK